MFTTIEVQETFRVEPHLLAYDLSAAVLHTAKRRFARRVIPGHGLCVTAVEVVALLPCVSNAGADDSDHADAGTTKRSARDGVGGGGGGNSSSGGGGGGDFLQLRATDRGGNVHVSANVVLAMWSPLAGDIVAAQVRSCTARGVRVSVLNAFDACFVRSDSLREPCMFDESARCWTWHTNGEAFEIRETDWVRVEIDSVEYDGDNTANNMGGSGAGNAVGILPPPAMSSSALVPSCLLEPAPTMHDDNGGSGDAGDATDFDNSASAAAIKQMSREERDLWHGAPLPMRAWALMDKDGLGLIEWWTHDEGEEGQESNDDDDDDDNDDKVRTGANEKDVHGSESGRDGRKDIDDENHESTSDDNDTADRTRWNTRRDGMRGSATA